MTAGDSPDCQPRSPEGAVTDDGLLRVGGTGGTKTAGLANPRADQIPVGRDQANEAAGNHVQISNSAFNSARASESCPTSGELFSRTTTSLRLHRSGEHLNNSRTNRLTRFLWTALPVSRREMTSPRPPAAPSVGTAYTAKNRPERRRPVLNARPNASSPRSLLDAGKQ